MKVCLLAGILGATCSQLTAAHVRKLHGPVSESDDKRVDPRSLRQSASLFGQYRGELFAEWDENDEKNRKLSRQRGLNLFSLFDDDLVPGYFSDWTDPPNVMKRPGNPAPNVAPSTAGPTPAPTAPTAPSTPAPTTASPAATRPPNAAPPAATTSPNAAPTTASPAATPAPNATPTTASPAATPAPNATPTTASPAATPAPNGTPTTASPAATRAPNATPTTASPAATPTTPPTTAPPITTPTPASPPSPTSTPNNGGLENPPFPSDTCNAQECELVIQVDESSGESEAILFDENFQINVEFIVDIRAEIACTYGEDFSILWSGPGPNFDEYVPMDNTQAGTEPDFDMGQAEGNGNLENVAPYIFVESGGSSFSAPFSGLGIYNAEAWDSSNAPYGEGEWNLRIDDTGPGESASVGTVTVRYCGVCPPSAS